MSTATCENYFNSFFYIYKAAVYCKWRKISNRLTYIMYISVNVRIIVDYKLFI